MFFHHRCPSNPRGNYRRADPQSEQIIVRQPSTFTTSVATNLDASSTTASINPLSFIIRLDVFFLADCLGFNRFSTFEATRACLSTPDSPLDFTKLADFDPEDDRRLLSGYAIATWRTVWLSTTSVIAQTASHVLAFIAADHVFASAGKEPAGLELRLVLEGGSGELWVFWNHWDGRLVYKMKALCLL